MNGHCESFDGRLGDDLLNGEIFHSLWVSRLNIEKWKNHYNSKRPRSALGYRPKPPKPSYRWIKGQSRPTFKLDHSNGAAHNPSKMRTTIGTSCTKDAMRLALWADHHMAFAKHWPNFWQKKVAANIKSCRCYRTSNPARLLFTPKALNAARWQSKQFGPVTV